MITQRWEKKYSVQRKVYNEYRAIHSALLCATLRLNKVITTPRDLPLIRFTGFKFTKILLTFVL